MPCECTQRGSCERACQPSPSVFSLQPISNADFIVPVEIEGTTHQVNYCVSVFAVEGRRGEGWGGGCLCMYVDVFAAAAELKRDGSVL